MMTQLVGTMHNSYSDLAQQELVRIRELETEITQLRTEIGSNDPKAIEAVGGDANSSVSESQLLLAQDDPAAAETVNPVTDEATSGDAPVPPAEPARNAGADPQRPRFSEGDVESHALLIERMSTLERERSNRWKRLMGMLTRSAR